ncbi:pre-mRNA splicing factor component-domain-containing protein [Limtongia smithiae]|uniref:pre-mRNA splicing factor component-domain-containing protein n=1 Tax=Limtongia smithiae TaxID=1125753 RepID=UPI0034CDA8B2
MPVYIKGGVWTNVEDEILRAAIAKYGLNQWARVSSLLARKTAKQVKARWNEWLDPAIKKLEWSREEDERLLHLAKLMPTQWRTIAPIVGRTATQCLERYQKLLDDAEAIESGELSLSGPGGEAYAADQIRKLRPGEIDPDPETKPARPDAIDMDEDEKEMLSEARARLANTQGKKAKRKDRERLLEEGRRLAILQKRRELKQAGINVKLFKKNRNEMDYNADIPFEHKPAVGFFDTTGELAENSADKARFDARTREYGTRRKDTEDPNASHKRRQQQRDEGKEAEEAERQAIIRAERLQKVQEQEQISKRRKLSLPAPQVSAREVDEIIRIGKMDAQLEEIAEGEEEGDIFGSSSGGGGIAELLKTGFSNLPKPKNDFELVAPEEDDVEPTTNTSKTPVVADDDEVPLETQLEEAELEEDAGERERKIREINKKEEYRALLRRSTVLQRNLPRPLIIDTTKLITPAVLATLDPIQAAIAREYCALVVSDALKYKIPNGRLLNAKDSKTVPDLEDAAKKRAVKTIADEVARLGGHDEFVEACMARLDEVKYTLPGL